MGSTDEMTQMKPWRPPVPLPLRCETARLWLRYFAMAYAASILEAVKSSRASLQPWLPWAGTDNLNEAQVIYNFERLRRDRERREPAPDTFGIGMFDPATGA